MKKKKYIWMQVTSDKYELPIRIADSSLKLARMCGVSNANICRSAQRARSSKHKFYSGVHYIRVDIKEE